MMFSDALIKYEDVINSGCPLLVKITINKQSEEESPRIMINSVRTIDEAIAEQAKGVIISVNNTAAVNEVKKILYSDKRGLNKVYIEPELDEWDVRIELEGGYAFSDNMMLTKLKSIPGVASVKEI
jgi:hypothetical protein